jgi:hypothetical protein
MSPAAQMGEMCKYIRKMEDEMAASKKDKEEAMGRVQKMESDMDTIKGDLGEAIAGAVEKHNLHAAAFKLVNTIQRMDAVKAMAFLTHFDDYRAKLELDKLAAPDLPGIDGDGEQEQDPPASATPPATELDENGQPKPMFN